MQGLKILSHNNEKQFSFYPVSKAREQGLSSSVPGTIKTSLYKGHHAIKRTFFALVLIGSFVLATEFGKLNIASQVWASDQYTKAQAARDVQIIVDRFTITEFCGQDSWSVRKGYEISRKRFLQSKLVTMKQFRQMRLQAIKNAETYLASTGPAEFNRWCSQNSEKATQFFLGLMSGNGGSYDTTFKP